MSTVYFLVVFVLRWRELKEMTPHRRPLADFSINNSRMFIDDLFPNSMGKKGFYQVSVEIIATLVREHLEFPAS